VSNAHWHGGDRYAIPNVNNRISGKPVLLIEHARSEQVGG